ncbi:MAG: DegV family protein [Chloroflexota bacterium]|nr:DegV family protein [Chloroflexota bacterium]
MSEVAIITDSTAYIPDDIVKQSQLSVVPLVLIWGEEEFQDGIDIEPDEFYARLQNAKIMPSTSQVTPQSFIDTFTRLNEQGKQILAVLISEKLSGTIASAIQAKKMLPDVTVEIVDSNTTAMALGYQAIMAARAAADGASLSECVAVAEEAKKNTGVVFAVDTLEFLHRGGRIGSGSRFLGTALKLKPILEVANGRVEAVERVRTRRKSLERLVDLLEERIDGRTPVHLASLNANAADEAQECLKMAEERLNVSESISSTVSPVIGTHTGPGTVGLAYLAGM